MTRRRGARPAASPALPAAVLDGLGEAVLLVGARLRVRHVSRAAREIWPSLGAGWGGPGAPVVDELFAPFDADGFAGLARRVRGDAVSTHDLAARRADGTLVPVRVRLSRLATEGRRWLVVAVENLFLLRSTEARLAAFDHALGTMQVGVTITDRQRRITYVNPAEAAMHGYAAEELIGREPSIFAPPELRSPLAPHRLREVKSWRRETVNLRKDGSTFPAEILSDLITGEGGEPLGMVSISQDISERKRAEEALRQSEERYALAIRGANDGIWDWDLASGKVHYSTRWKEMIGRDEWEVGDSLDDWLSHVHPEDVGRLREDLEEHLAGDLPLFENEHRMLHKDGSYRFMLARGVAVRDASGAARRMAGSQTDITERRFNDPLTGLPNRALLMDRLEGAWGRARRRQSTRVALLFLDLDRFKVVNDSLGHPAGDQLLVAVARRLEGCLRPGDTVARIGGDEFTVVLEEVSDVEEATRVADRIHERLAEPVMVGGQEIFTSASVGIAVAGEGVEGPEDLLRDADIAMYRAKAAGRARTQLFDQQMRADAQEQMRTGTELRHALERGELVIHYQPIVTIEGRSVVGFEALLRWAHPERGLLLPADFLPLAEETGLIIPIGRWVLREACRQLRRWQTRRRSAEEPAIVGVSMAVNLSVRELSQPDLVPYVTSVLEETGLAPGDLALEITEGALVEDFSGLAARLEELRALGIRVCIDDFGTGYSSLSYLHQLPVDTLKIDRSFVSGAEATGKRADLVESIVRLAHDLGIEVIAEGVETEAQLARLSLIECEEMQGFWFSAAVDRRRALALLKRG